MPNSQRIIGAAVVVAPVHCVAPKAVQQSSLPSAWQLRKRAEQILEVKQQIETTNTNDKYRVKSLKKKLKQLERQHAFIKALGAPGPETSACFPSPAAPTATTASSTLNPTALEWNPHTLPIAKRNAIYGISDSSPAINKIVPVVDNFPAVAGTVTVKYDYDDFDYDDSIFFPVASSPAPSFVDSGYGSSG